jgi:hypothetical protein
MAKSDKELEEMEKVRDIWQEVLAGIRELQAGKGKKVSVSLSSTARVRQATGLSQQEFADIWGFRFGPCKTGNRAAENPRELRRPFSKSPRKIPLF